MARISEKSRRFRTKEQIVGDMVKVLNMDLTYGTKFAVLSEAFWVWSEFEGKHNGCRFWSAAALDSKHDVKNLVHEHVVPRKEILSKFDLRPVPRKVATERSVRSIFSRLCIWCIVTKEEDKRLNSLGLKSRMPDGWGKRGNTDIWARYRKAKIKWVDLCKK